MKPTLIIALTLLAGCATKEVPTPTVDTSKVAAATNKAKGANAETRKQADKTQTHLNKALTIGEELETTLQTLKKNL